MPSMFKKESKKKDLIKNLDKIYERLQLEHQISPGDFPGIDVMRVNSLIQRFIGIQSRCIVRQLCRRIWGGTTGRSSINWNHGWLKLSIGCLLKKLHICLRWFPRRRYPTTKSPCSLVRKANKSGFFFDFVSSLTGLFQVVLSTEYKMSNRRLVTVVEKA